MEMTDIRQILAVNLTRLWEGASETQRANLPIAQTTWKRMLSGRSNPELQNLVVAARHFHVDVSDLLRTSGRRAESVNDRNSYNARIDLIDLTQSIEFVTNLLDAENLYLPKPLLARAIALVYSELGSVDKGTIRNNVVEFVRKSKISG